MSRPLPHALSPSSIGTFTTCPLSFRFSYLDRLPEAPSAPASRGTLVHLALEHLMGLEPGERTLDRALGFLDQARDELAEDPEFTGLGLTDEEWVAFHEEAAGHVRRYFELEDPTTVEVVETEIKLEGTYEGVRIRGVIDRLDRRPDGSLVVTDYKTGSVPGEAWEGKALTGVHLYALLVEQNYGQRPAQVQLLYLSKPEAIIAAASERTVERAGMRTKAVWGGIAKACEQDDFRPRTSALCGWCSFQAYCPAFGGDPERAAVELLAAAPDAVGTEPAAESLSLLDSVS